MEKTRLPSNTAGNRMITAFPSVRIGETIRNIEKMIVERAQTFDTIDYVYVVDQDRVLHGVISTKEVLAISNKDANVEDVMKRRLVVAHPINTSGKSSLPRSLAQSKAS